VDATGSLAAAHRWSGITRTLAMKLKLGGGFLRHTIQHVSNMTDGSDTMMWHREMLEMGKRCCLPRQLSMARPGSRSRLTA
jgi:hypothetical protein